MDKGPAEDARLLRLYGKVSAVGHLTKRENARKFFDSGDYALSKAGKTGENVGAVGSQHPTPANIPHHPSPVSRSSVVEKDSAFASTHGQASVQPQQHPGSAPGQTPMPAPMGGSPVKESSFLNRELSAEDIDTADEVNHTEEEQQITTRSDVNVKHTGEQAATNTNAKVNPAGKEQQAHKGTDVKSAGKTPIKPAEGQTNTKEERLPIRM